mmetsp:Transcript_81768/g.226508  ORF Transcript_81768/g.226508 Transcript_81768/m.226508 type:complete len:238 (+) Transcript_81768:1462-2175(+)
MQRLKEPGPSANATYAKPRCLLSPLPCADTEFARTRTTGLVIPRLGRCQAPTTCTPPAGSATAPVRFTTTSTESSMAKGSRGQTKTHCAAGSSNVRRAQGTPPAVCCVACCAANGASPPPALGGGGSTGACVPPATLAANAWSAARVHDSATGVVGGTRPAHDSTLAAARDVVAHGGAAMTPPAGAHFCSCMSSGCGALVLQLRSAPDSWPKRADSVKASVAEGLSWLFLVSLRTAH